MKLIEREKPVAALQAQFEEMLNGESSCVLISGEAGMGKTSLIRKVCNEYKNTAGILWGTCDALFTPRPLAPLYDIALQMGTSLAPHHEANSDERSNIFSRLFHEISSQKKPSVVVFEDIHWADEATLDFIKFLARRILQSKCLFILTYRDNEVHFRHPLRNVLGQLPVDSLVRIKLEPLSSGAVEKMAAEKGFDGKNLYNISGGNPFYVNEILASYSPGIPDNIRDSILAVFNRQKEETKQVWELLSIFPTGAETTLLEKMVPCFAEPIREGVESKILVEKNGRFFFKHELYRITVEEALSPLSRIRLNKKTLDLFLTDFEEKQETERILHHAKNAGANELIAHYAPLAAGKSAAAGAHADAGNLYSLAIQYQQFSDKHDLVNLYEAYAYECYLINWNKEAISYTEKALTLWKNRKK